MANRSEECARVYDENRGSFVVTYAHSRSSTREGAKNATLGVLQTRVFYESGKNNRRKEVGGGGKVLVWGIFIRVYALTVFT